MNKKYVLMAMLLALVMLLAACGDSGQTEATEAAADAGTEEVTEAVDTESDATEAETESEQQAAEERGDIILSTTTSTEDSGLLDAILPDFTEKTGYGVKVVAVGTGAALQNGRDGNADVLLVHAKASEEEFVEEGFGVERFDVMYNDYVIVGPEADPAGLKTDHAEDPIGALQKLQETQTQFVSRGDDSGTHKKELQLWETAGVEDPAADAAAADWYVSAGMGMGDVLNMASESEAYTLTDRATFLSMRDNLDLAVLVEGADDLFNQYGVIAVHMSVGENINPKGGQAFVDWILSDDVQAMIAEYGVEEYGEPLFVPNAN